MIAPLSVDCLNDGIQTLGFESRFFRRLLADQESTGFQPVVIEFVFRPFVFGERLPSPCQSQGVKIVLIIFSGFSESPADTLATAFNRQSITVRSPVTEATEADAWLIFPLAR